MDDDLVAATSSIPALPLIITTPNVWSIVAFSTSQYAGNTGAECTRLVPTAVGQRRVVWCRRGQMPLLITGI
jgi:hypothetical protein